MPGSNVFTVGVTQLLQASAFPSGKWALKSLAHGIGEIRPPVAGAWPCACSWEASSLSSVSSHACMSTPGTDTLAPAGQVLGHVVTPRARVLCPQLVPFPLGQTAHTCTLQSTPVLRLGRCGPHTRMRGPMEGPRANAC